MGRMPVSHWELEPRHAIQPVGCPSFSIQKKTIINVPAKKKGSQTCKEAKDAVIGQSGCSLNPFWHSARSRSERLPASLLGTANLSQEISRLKTTPDIGPTKLFSCRISPLERHLSIHTCNQQCSISTVSMLCSHPKRVGTEENDRIIDNITILYITGLQTLASPDIFKIDSFLLPSLL
jgi:hypothetical protein